MKTERIELRLSKEDKRLFQEKANNYISMSALIIDAVKSFNETGGSNKIETLNNWSKVFSKHNIKINKVGYNINQVAHYINIVNKENIPLSENVLLETKLLLKEWNQLFSEMVLLQRDFRDKVLCF